VATSKGGEAWPHNGPGMVRWAIDRAIIAVEIEAVKMVVGLIGSSRCLDRSTTGSREGDRDLQGDSDRVVTYTPNRRGVVKRAGKSSGRSRTVVHYRVQMKT
jgi:hypothetical protein